MNVLQTWDRGVHPITDPRQTWAGFSSGSSPLWFSCRLISHWDSCSKKQKNQKLGKPINLYVALCMLWPLHDHPVSISLLETNVFMLQRMENLDYLFLPGFPLQPFKSVALARRTRADNQLLSTFFPSQLWRGTSLTMWCGEEVGWVFSTIHACTQAFIAHSILKSVLCSLGFHVWG